jgi:uncharacterized membrane protein YeiH
VGLQEHIYVSLSVLSLTFFLYIPVISFPFFLSSLHFFISRFVSFVIRIVTLRIHFTFEAYLLQCIYFMLIIIKGAHGSVVV